MSASSIIQLILATAIVTAIASYILHDRRHQVAHVRGVAGQPWSRLPTAGIVRWARAWRGEIVQVLAVLICVSWVAASVFFVSSAGKSPDAAGAAGVQGSLSVLLDGRSVTSDQYRIVESNGSQSSMRIEVLKTVSVEIFERKRISIDDYIIIIYGLFVALLIACLPFFVRRSIVSGRNSPKRILGARSRSRNRGHDALSSIEEATTVIGSEHDISAIEFDAFKKESEELYINGRKKYDEVISTQAESWLHEHHGQYIVVGVVDDSWAVGANAKSASENYDSQYGSGTGQTVIFKIGDPDDLLRAW